MKYTINNLCLLLSLVLSFTACKKPKEPIIERNEEISEADDSSFQEVENSLYFAEAKQVLEKHCIQCHSPDSNRKFIISSRTTEKDLINQGVVIPGSSYNSLLVQRLKYSFGKNANMPLGENDFSRSDRYKITNWIANINNKPDIVEEDDSEQPPQEDPPAPDPVITIESPTPGQVHYFKDNITIAGNCTNGLNVDIQEDSTLLKRINCTNNRFSTTLAIGGQDGERQLSVLQANQSGKVSRTNILYYKDTTAPTLQVNFPISNSIIYDQNIIVSGLCEANASLVLSGSLSTPVNLNCPVTGSFNQAVQLSNGDGNKSIQILHSDALGNSNSQTIAFTKDTKVVTAPKLSILSPAQGSYSKSVVNINGECEPNLVINISGDVSAPFTQQCPSDGIFFLNATLSSAQGSKTIRLSQKRETQESVVFLSAIKDSIAPALNPTLPQSAFYVTNNLSLSGSCEANLNIDVEVFGSFPQSKQCPSNGQFALTFQVAGNDGSKSVMISQTDKAGNKKSLEFTVIKDTVAPLLSISAPTENSVTTSNVIIVKGFCESDIKVSIQEENNQEVQVNCVGSSFIKDYTLSNALGNKVITVSQEDGAGNKSSIVTTVVKQAAADQFPMLARDILANHCIACHSSSWGTSLTTVDELNAFALGNNGGRIVPGNPDQSLIIQKMYYGPNHNNNSVSKMPPAYAPQYQGFTQAQFDIVNNYIAALSSASPNNPNPNETPENEQDGGTPPNPFICDSSQTPSVNNLKRLSKLQYSNTLKDLLARSFSSSLASQIMTNISPLLNNLANDKSAHDFPDLDNSISNRHIENYFEIAYKFAEEVTSSNSRLTSFVGESCATNATSTSCKQRFIDRFAPIVLRHPLSSEESTRYKQELSNLSYLEIIAFFLLEPDFLYHTEFRGNPINNNEKHLALTSHEVANRISYLFFQSMPDEQLRTAANSSSSFFQNYDSIVNAVIERARAKKFAYKGIDRNSFGHFMAGWFLLDDIPEDQELNQKSLTTTLNLNYSNNTSLPSNLDLDIFRKDAIVEMMDLYEYFAFEGNGKVTDLFTTDISFAKGPYLPKAYGVNAWNGDINQLVRFPANERSGILTRSGFHLYSGIFSRPVQKGVKILRKVLCETIEAPADNSTPSGVVLEADFTARERIHAMTMVEGTSCKGCHQRINPLGFALEDYDIFGRHRDNEYIVEFTTGNIIATKDVDASSIPQIHLSDTTEVDGGADLSNLIASTDKAHACIVRHFHRYAFRQTESLQKDSCSLHHVYNKLEEGEGGVGSMMLGLTSSPAFTSRYHEGK